MDNLLDERSLLDIFWKSLRISRSKFNFFATLLAASCLTVQVLHSTQTIKELLDIVRLAALNGLSLSLGILGFLIAGFTILTTVSSPGLTLLMADKVHEKSGLSYLKYNYIGLVVVFIWFLLFAFSCLIVIAFGGTGSAISALLESLGSCSEPTKHFIAKTSFVYIYTFQFYLLLQLKTFVFNIYHISMTSAMWIQDQEKKKKAVDSGEVGL